MEKDLAIIEIDKYITKQGKRILYCIYKKNEMYSSELAELLHISRSAMSNALDRLKNAPEQLIIAKKTGRQKVYSLTHLAREYVDTSLHNVKNREMFDTCFNTSNKNEDEVQNDEKLLNECINELDEINKYWREHAIEYIEDDIYNEDNELIKEKIKDFINIGLKIKLHSNELMYEKYIQSMQTHRLMQYVNEIILRREILNYLWDLVANDWEYAYKLIDVFFSKDRFIVSGRNTRECLQGGLTKRQVYDISFVMQEIVTNAIEKKLSKNEFYHLLKEEGAEDGRCAYYIADKYATIIEE